MADSFYKSMSFADSNLLNGVEFLSLQYKVCRYIVVLFLLTKSDFSTLPCSISKFFKGSLSAARSAAAFVRGDDVIHKLFTELAYRYK